MGKHKNTTQDAILLRFMQNNPDLAKGFAKGDRVKLEELWKELTVELNSNGPPSKDTSGWKKVWIDWKALVRRKIAHNSSEARATGGGPFNKFVLTKMEEAVGQLCGIFAVIEGVENALDFGNEHTEVETIEDYNFLLEENVASTSKDASMQRCNAATPTPKRQKDTSWNDTMKQCMKGQTDAMVSIAHQLKELYNDEEHIKCLKDLKRELKDSNHELRAIRKSIQHNIEEKGKHYFRMEQLREEEIKIKRRKLELEELKINYHTENM